MRWLQRLEILCGNRIGHNHAMETTNIANRDVPIKPGAKTTVTFSGEKGTDEAGAWEFWALVTSNWIDVGRCRAGDDPGERWRRMGGEKGHERSAELAKRAEYLRPATARELEGWLNSHLKEAKFAESCQVAGQAMEITPQYRLEPKPVQ
jgi:hypothetical protein